MLGFAYLMASLLKGLGVTLPTAALMAFPLSGAAAAAATQTCTVQAPVRATAGQFFNVKWNLGGSGVGALYRSDTLVGTMSTQTGTMQVYATNVLGPHTYTLKVHHGTTVITTCSAQVNFVYTPDKVKGYDIVVIAGQSNGAGHGNGPFTDPLEDAGYDSDIVQIGRIGDSNMKVVPVGYWQNGVLSDGVQFWGRAENDLWMSFAVSFARWYAKNDLAPGRKVLIVPAAYGGTEISLWLDESPTAKLPLYSDMMQRVQTALALPGNNRVVAFIWDQGETDTLHALNNPKSGMNPTVYQQDLETLIGRVRAAIPNGNKIATVGVLFAPDWLKGDATGTAMKVRFEKAIVRAVQDAGPGTYAPTRGLTSDEDIGQSGGYNHFSAQALVTLGKRIEGVYAKLIGDATAPDADLDAALSGQDINTVSNTSN